MPHGSANTGAPVPLWLALIGLAAADFLLPAGNWTRRTNEFSQYHFSPGYNEAGVWDIVTGGNWSETAHVDLRLLGDAAAYVCPCPLPPCAPDEGPPKPGFNTSIFTCIDPAARWTGNTTYVACTVFHQERTNITCVSPTFAVSCDVPSYDPDVPVTEVDGNDVVPSRSFYNDHVTAVSCLARGMGEQDFSRFGTTTFSTTTESQTFFTDQRALHTSLSQEQCSVVCEQVCRSVCVHEHMSVHQLFEQLNAWECSSWVELPSCGSLRVTPPLVPPRAQAAPTPPGAPPAQSGGSRRGLLRPPPLASKTASVPLRRAGTTTRSTSTCGSS